MRRKFKKFLNFLDSSKMKLEEITNSLAVWFGSIVNFQPYKIQTNIKKLYFELFPSYQNT